jgi:hypothetical protein
VREALDLLIAEQYTMLGAQAWLWALTAYCNGQGDLTSLAIAEFTGGKLQEQRVDPALLITLWHERSAGLDKNPAYWHPRLPRSLTGLPQDLVRLQGQVSPLEQAVIRSASFPVSPVKGADLLAVSRPADSQSINQRGSISEWVPGRAISIVIVNSQGDSMTDGGAKYTINGPVGSAGDGASAHNFVQAYQNQDPKDLQMELARLREVMRKDSTTLEHDLAIAEVGQAEAALANGDTETAKGHLAKAGRWAWSTATAIGAGVAAAAIKAAIGF